MLPYHGLSSLSVTVFTLWILWGSSGRLLTTFWHPLSTPMIIGVTSIRDLFLSSPIGGGNPMAIGVRLRPLLVTFFTICSTHLGIIGHLLGQIGDHLLSF